MAVNKVVYGATVLVDLTEDTVSASDLAEGVTAHSADGELITGTLPKTTGIIYNADSVEFKDWSSSPDTIRLKKAITEDRIFKTGGSGLSIDAKASEFGDATPEDVAKGKTFTSASGLKVTGTHECASGGDSTLNCEMQTISNVTSPKATFKGTGGTYKVYGYGKGTSSGYTTPKYAFAGGKYYTISSWGNDTTTTLNITVDSRGNISGLPSLASGELVIVRVPS